MPARPRRVTGRWRGWAACAYRLYYRARAPGAGESRRARHWTLIGEGDTWLIDQLAEQRIGEALARGEFDDLPGKGRALRLDDDALVPEELRVAYRVLRNAGFVPPEVGVRREIADVEALLRRSIDPQVRSRAARKMNLLRSRLGDRPLLDGAGAGYSERLLAHLAGEE